MDSTAAFLRHYRVEKMPYVVRTSTITLAAVYGTGECVARLRDARFDMERVERTGVGDLWNMAREIP